MSVLRIPVDSLYRVSNKLSSFCFGNVNSMEHPVDVGHYLKKRYGNDHPAEIFAALCDKYNLMTDRAKEGKSYRDFPEDILKDNINLLCGLKADRTCNIWQLLKFLNCYAYNIDLEGWTDEMNNDTDYLYFKETLECVIHKLESHIIRHLPEYDQAGWCSMPSKY